MSAEKKEIIEKEEKSQKLNKKYIEAVGRRKTATARVRLYEEKGYFLVNDKSLNQYFGIERFRKTVLAPFELLKLKDKFSVSAKVSGGGIMAQAEAIRHGLSRALVKYNESFKKLLREAGFLTRDPRMVERKKYGLKKARKAPQWSKR
ncbi:MAG: 30S ribosomal protein S9 [Candidatus Parcubacteria bacterium]|nr:MAG: 30S ribosomal protein S9 [Candidatus Parcubacteria bacterium]